MCSCAHTCITRRRERHRDREKKIFCVLVWMCVFVCRWISASENDKVVLMYMNLCSLLYFFSWTETEAEWLCVSLSTARLEEDHLLRTQVYCHQEGIAWQLSQGTSVISAVLTGILYSVITCYQLCHEETMKESSIPSNSHDTVEGSYTIK